MSVTAELPMSKETQDAPAYDESSYREQEPPPYSEDPAVYPPDKAETPSTDQPTAENGDINPEAPSETNPELTSSAFDDQTVRRAFVRKVFSILTLQLLFTFSVVCVFTFSTVVKDAVQDNLWAYISSFLLFIVVAVSLGCCQSFSRRHPWNIVGLVIVTVSLSYMVGTIASYHDTTSVVITMGATIAITLAIITYSAQTRYEFTVCNGILLVLAVDVIMFGFFSTFYYSYIGDVAYGCLGALLFSMFLMIDCQMLMGIRSCNLDPEEYINAALIIYLDIVLIFLYLLGKK